MSASTDLMDLPGEEWADAYGWDGMYQASSEGRIKSLSREVVCGNHTRWTRERILKQSLSDDGMLRVSFSQNSEVTEVKVHKVVFEAFNKGPAKDGNWVIHKNKVKTDNRKSNLSEASPSASNTLNYALGASTYRDIGSRSAAKAVELDQLLVVSDSSRICRVCKRDLPNNVFLHTARGFNRTCLDCRLTKNGVINVGKQRYADELFAKGLRRCNPCGRILSLTDFGPSRSSFGGRNHICPSCAREKDVRLRSKSRKALKAGDPTS